MAKTQTVAFQLKCKECGNLIKTTSKNATENKEKIELSRHCKFCRKHTKQGETKIRKAAKK